MVFRRAAAFGLLLSATLAGATSAQAQGFFETFEMSPRQIARSLDDDGYALRGPLIRHGDVYLCDAVSEDSGRSLRLIVSARDGRVMQRFASTPRYRDGDEDYDRGMPRPPRDVGGPRSSDDDEEDAAPGRHDRMALGDIFNPPSRVYGSDGLFGSRPAPLPSPDAPSAKPKRQAVKKHKDPALAKAPADGASPPPNADAAKPASPAMANVAPSADAPKEAPKAVEPPKPAATPAAVTPAAEAEKPKPAEAPKPVATPAKTVAQAPEPKAETRPEAKPEPKPAGKKLNDLPVGTLD